MLMPARVVATLTEAQTRSVAASAAGIESMSRASPSAYALVHQGGEAADEVDADGGRRPVEGEREGDEVAGVSSGGEGSGVTAMRLLMMGTPYSRASVPRPARGGRRPR